MTKTTEKSKIEIHFVLKAILFSPLLLFLLYTGWAAYLTYFGIVIGETAVGEVRVEVTKLPLAFSYFTPLDQKYFENSIQIKIQTETRTELIYKFREGSFYPQRATITALTPNEIHIDLGGPVIDCQIHNSEVVWTKKWGN